MFRRQRRRTQQRETYEGRGRYHQGSRIGWPLERNVHRKTELSGPFRRWKPEVRFGSLILGTNHDFYFCKTCGLTDLQEATPKKPLSVQ